MKFEEERSENFSQFIKQCLKEEDYLKNVNQSNFTVQFLPIIEQAVLQEDAWWNRLNLMQSIFDLQEHYSQISTENASGINTQVNQEILKCVSRLIEKEKNPQILQYF